VSAPSAPETVPPHLAPTAERLRAVTAEVSTEGGGGAGILWAPELVVTNAHVARAPRVRVRLADDGPVEGVLVAADRRADLALIRLPRTTLTPAPLAVVVALGHPLGLRRALTAGVVHALGPVSPGGRRWIHAALRLAPGNSGGPLADTAGHVVGINTMITGGLALAIPINDVRRFVSAALAAPA
jgi:serine protease Do